jgi:hypothetical protein
MFLRISSAAIVALALAACSSGGDAGDSVGTDGASAASAAQTVPCALAGSRSFTAQCGLETSTSDGKSIVTLRHPDGGFRRLIALDGGKRYAAADGSDEVVLEVNGAEIEVTLGDDHYLLPGPTSADAAKR